MSSGVSTYRQQEESIDLTAQTQPVGGGEQELLTLNMGPHHPATHGVLRLLVTLEGEVVRDLKPIIGYLHTGIEKTAEDKSYWKAIPVIERMDYLAYYFNAMAFCGAVETLLELEVPKRAQYLRVIHLELNRIMSHLVWLGTSALDLGAISMFWYCFREREKILDLFEMSSGQRMHTRYIQVGGVMDDIPRASRPSCAASWTTCPTGSTSTATCSTATRSCCAACAARARSTRPRCWGSASPARCCARPATRGTCARPCPTRATRTSSSASRWAPRATTATATWCAWRRCRSRSRSSSRRSTGCPRGRHITDDRKVALPPRHELATSMEALIHHFKLVTEGFRVPPGEVYYPIESPRGELGCFVRSDGSSKPARVHMRDPSFVNLQATAPMVADAYIADLIATLAMVDPILGGIDRALMAIDPTRVPRFGHGSRVPGWDDAADLRKDPRGSPTRRHAGAGGPAPAHRGVHGEVPRPPLGGDPGAARGPEGLRLVLARGRRAGRVRDAPDARLPDRGGDLLRHALHAAGGAPPGLGVHEHLVLAVRRRRALDAFPEEVGDDADFNLRTFECLGACDIAPMASVNGEYVGPIALDEVPTVVQQIRDGEEPLPDKQLSRRKSVDPKAAPR